MLNILPSLVVITLYLNNNNKNEKKKVNKQFFTSHAEL